MLVNTCAVRDNAEQRVIGRVGELQRHKRAGRRAGRGGCMAQRLGPGAPGPGTPGGPGGGPRRVPNLPRSSVWPSRSAGQRHRVPLLGALRRRARVREKGPTAFVTVSGAATTAAHLHRSSDPRDRSGATTSGCCDEKWQVWWSRALQGHVLGKTVNSCRDGDHDFATCSRRRAVSRGCIRSAFQPVPHRFHAQGHQGHRNDLGSLRAHPPAGTERLESGTQEHAPALYPRAISEDRQGVPPHGTGYRPLDGYDGRVSGRPRAVRGDPRPRHSKPISTTPTPRMFGPGRHPGGSPRRPCGDEVASVRLRPADRDDAG